MAGDAPAACDGLSSKSFSSAIAMAACCIVQPWRSYAAILVYWVSSSTSSFLLIFSGGHKSNSSAIERPPAILERLSERRYGSTGSR